MTFIECLELTHLHDDVIKVNIFRVTGHLCGEFTGHRWIPLTKASEAELWCFLWSAPEQAFEQILETPSRSLWRHCNGFAFLQRLRLVMRILASTEVPASLPIWTTSVSVLLATPDMTAKKVGQGSHLSSWASFKRLTTLRLGSSKITTVADFTALALLRPLKL